MKTILVPLDTSPFAEQALPLALGLARRHGASLRLAIVHVPMVSTLIDAVPHVDPRLDAELRDHERGYIEKLAARLSEGGIPVTSVVLDGPVVEALEAEARASGADLVVMSTHGRGGLSRMWLGSVADGLVRRGPAPVLLVRPSEDGAVTEEAAAFRHILVPLDGSALAEEALDLAVQVGEPAGAKYTLVQAISPVTVIGPHSTEAIAAEYQAQHEKEAERALGELADRLRARGAEADVVVITHPSPAAAILDVAESRGADLICLATHGRTGLPRLFLGSVADKVVRSAKVPVLVVRPGE